MSLFPIRLKPGGTITVHLRFRGPNPVWIQRKDYLIDPRGQRKICYERTIPYIPSAMRTEDERKLIINTGQIFGGAPLLMAARYLQSEAKRTDYFMDMLVGLRDDMHHYYTFKIPEDAPLGRYSFELEDRINGKVLTSQTADTDYFFVEKLELVKTISQGKACIAYIENHSPEPVLAQLCEFSADPNKAYTQKIIQLDAQKTTEVLFHEAAILMYRDGEDFLRLNKEKSCLRNPIFQATPNAGFILIYINDAFSKRAYELVGQAQEIWQRADGFLPRSLIRTEANATRYDEMLEMGIILEID